MAVQASKATPMTAAAKAEAQRKAIASAKAKADAEKIKQAAALKVAAELRAKADAAIKKAKEDADKAKTDAEKKAAADKESLARSAGAKAEAAGMNAEAKLKEAAKIATKADEAMIRSKSLAVTTLPLAAAPPPTVKLDSSLRLGLQQRFDQFRDQTRDLQKIIEENIPGLPTGAVSFKEDVKRQLDTAIAQRDAMTEIIKQFVGEGTIGLGDAKRIASKADLAKLYTMLGDQAVVWERIAKFSADFSTWNMLKTTFGRIGKTLSEMSAAFYTAAKTIIHVVAKIPEAIKEIADLPWWAKALAGSALGFVVVKALK